MGTHNTPPSDAIFAGSDGGAAPIRTNGRDAALPAVLEDDLGTALIHQVYSIWQVADEWSVWEPRGFCWWGHRHRQRVWSEPGYDDHGFVIYRLCAETDVVRGLPEGADTDVALAAFNEHASLFGLVHLPEEGRIVLHTSAYAHQQTAAWTGKLLARSAILQPIFAERIAPIFSENLGGEPDESIHPDHGLRPEPDETLGVLDSRYIPAGRGPSAWSGSPEFERTAEFLNRGDCFATADPGGLTAEFAFRAGQTSLNVVDTRERHPTFGSGVLLRLHLPAELSSEEAAALAGHLNRLERNGGVIGHMAGAWTTADGRPVFVTFVPSVMYQDNLLQNLVVSMALRARDLAGLLSDEEPGCSVVETIIRRLGVDPSGIEEA